MSNPCDCKCQVDGKDRPASMGGVIRFNVGGVVGVGQGCMFYFSTAPLCQPHFSVIIPISKWLLQA